MDLNDRLQKRSVGVCDIARLKLKDQLGAYHHENEKTKYKTKRTRIEESRKKKEIKERRKGAFDGTTSIYPFLSSSLTSKTSKYTGIIGVVWL